MSLISSFLLLVIAAAGAQTGQVGPGDPAKGPPARPIPGLTAEDPFPGGCVDCHVDMPQANMDVRISTAMKAWCEKVEPRLLAKAQSVAAKGVTLRGKHPVVDDALEDIPAACITCHRKDSKIAPPFSPMVHAIHLSGGEENHFMTLFQGECTHCHKFDADTGAWKMPSGREKQTS